MVDLPADAVTVPPRPGASCQVWQSEGVFFKQHRSARGFAQEVHALRALTPALGSAPRLLGVDEGRRLLRLSAVPGQDADAMDLTEDQRAVIAREAGRWLAALHQMPCPQDDPLSVGAAVARRIEAADAVAAREAFGDGAAFDGLTRCWCHRDFRPRNWRVTPALEVSILDFEHTRPDLWLVDLVRLDEPVRVAVLEGMGRRLTPRERDALTVLRLLDGAQTLRWGLRHGERCFIDEGRRVLADARRV
ncbi:MAG: aminoglycoside phosphotransferase family protein [Alphaproteobacteria bacterium]|nr:aminoglycoside phosphotransferase family protein [Alphaproteobacteria bacterium]